MGTSEEGYSEDFVRRVKSRHQKLVWGGARDVFQNSFLKKKIQLEEQHN